VATTRENALIVTSSGRVPGTERQSVYLIVMKGNFTLANAPRPPRAKAPSGQYLSMTFDTGTLKRLDLSLRRRAPSVPLQSVGPVSDLMRKE
jgi:hypothetical protein